MFSFASLAAWRFRAADSLASADHSGKLRALLRKVRQELLSWRATVALLGGATLALAFPLPGVAGLAWFAPGLILLATLGAPRGTAFRLGYLAGLAHNLISLRWLLHIPFPAGAIAGWLALSAYVALYPALWTWLCWRLLPGLENSLSRQPLAGSLRRHSSAAANGDSGEPADRGEETASPAWRAALASVAERSWAQRTLWALACATAWVATEIAVGRLFTGFPWNPLGASQYRLLPIIHIAAFTGVHGVSFLVVWVAVALFIGGLRLALRVTEPDRGLTPASPWRQTLPPVTTPRGPFVSFRFALLADLGVPLLAVMVVAYSGARALVQPRSAEREIKLALVQPSIPQRLIWDPAETTNRFHKLMDLSALALASKPDVLVWPEAALPSFSDANYRALTNLIAAHHTWMVFGADDFIRRPDGEYDAYNSAFLFDPAGQYVATYHKQLLVIFGEYVPLARWLPFTKYLTPIEGSFASGDRPVTFETTSPVAHFSVLICFEDVFGRDARKHVEPDTDFLLNLTNDGWFGESSAQWQQAANAVFRAVENGVPLVRCTNNGLTCWIDELGRIRDGLGLKDGNIYQPGFLSLRLPMRPAGTANAPTFYRQHGDLFGWGCVVWVVFIVGLRWSIQRNRRGKSTRRQASPAAVDK